MRQHTYTSEKLLNWSSQNGQIKMLIDTIKGIKAVCGENFPLSVRVTPKHYMKAVGQGALPGEEFEEVGRDINESVELTKLIAEHSEHELMSQLQHIY